MQDTGQCPTMVNSNTQQHHVPATKGNLQALLQGVESSNAQNSGGEGERGRSNTFDLLDFDVDGEMMARGMQSWGSNTNTSTSGTNNLLKNPPACLPMSQQYGMPLAAPMPLAKPNAAHMMQAMTSMPKLGGGDSGVGQTTLPGPPGNQRQFFGNFGGGDNAVTGGNMMNSAVPGNGMHQLPGSNQVSGIGRAMMNPALCAPVGIPNAPNMNMGPGGLIHTPPTLLGTSYEASHFGKRPRSGSISGRLRSASDLEDRGIIDRQQRNVLKDLIISSNDVELQAALDNYETGDSSQLEEMVKSGALFQRHNQNDLDLLDDLDLDFLNFGDIDGTGETTGAGAGIPGSGTMLQGTQSATAAAPSVSAPIPVKNTPELPPDPIYNPIPVQVPDNCTPAMVTPYGRVDGNAGDLELDFNGDYSGGLATELNTANYKPILEGGKMSQVQNNPNVLDIPQSSAATSQYDIQRGRSDATQNSDSTQLNALLGETGIPPVPSTQESSGRKLSFGGWLGNLTARPNAAGTNPQVAPPEKPEGLNLFGGANMFELAQLAIGSVFHPGEVSTDKSRGSRKDQKDRDRKKREREKKGFDMQKDVPIRSKTAPPSTQKAPPGRRRESASKGRGSNKAVRGKTEYDETTKRETPSGLGMPRSMSDPNLSISTDADGLLQVQRPEGWVGAYSPDSRKLRIERFLAKRNNRVWAKTVKYDVRKNFADSRLRVKGRFVKKEDEQLMRDLMSLT